MVKSDFDTSHSLKYQSHIVGNEYNSDLQFIFGIIMQMENYFSTIKFKLIIFNINTA